MARGNARREAYTAGGKAPLMSLEILNDDAFIVVSVGGSTGSAANGEAPWVVRGRRTEA